MRRAACMAMMFLMLGATPAALAGDDEAGKSGRKRAEIDAKAQATLDELFGESAKAKELYESAYGYAVFGSWKFALGISGGGGTGVAVNKKTGDRTYMKMGTGGVGLGLGGKKYQVVFIFENAKRFDSFVEKGWKADTSATAAAGTAAVDVGSGFVDGVAIYQITESGLMAQAEVAGTKFWKDKKLN